MSSDQPNSPHRALLEKALLELRQLRAERDAEKRARTEPIAIIGAGCRFPGGVDTPEAFWQLLHAGVDAVATVPASRWDSEHYYDPDPDAAGKMYVKTGAFLADIERFEPAFFGIAPSEAASLDPQQRLLLETSWEALEHAGIAPDRLQGSRTGVFIGLFWDDYSAQRLYAADPAKIDGYRLLSGLRGLAAGRIAYTLGLQGPVMELDTACSSSLLAVHLACQSLRAGECDLALAGGVNLLLSPEATLGLCRLRVLAPDGRCKAFDAAADGFGQGEGCGMIALKRLSDARTDGDLILAVIRGSAVNHDGRSNGLTAPNGLAQENLLREALANAGLEPGQIQYIETHGTGTPLGDPIEVSALATVLGHNRTAPLALGSVKTNFGHLESAAGVAALLKTALALQHREIPPNLHFHEPNPHIPWQDLPFTVPTAPTPWQGQPRRAGISSFGMSGTNVHVILEEAPAPAVTVSAVERPLHLLCLSAKNMAALRESAGRYTDFLASAPAISLADVGFTAHTGRAHFAQRLAISADSPGQLRARLAAFSADGADENVISGEVPARKVPKIAFLCTGQGAQYAGMGRELFDTQPTFRRALERCAELLRPQLDKPLLDVLFGSAKALLDQTAYTQPALFALEYALAELWRSWGVTPTAMLGHSVGEYVAACLAGVFTLEDGLKLIAARGRLMQQLPTDGAMTAVLAPEGEVAAAIASHADEVAIAAVNGPRNTVISGRRAAVQQIGEQLAAAGIEIRPLNVSHAFHSPLMEPMLDEFEQIARTINFSPPQRTLIANLTGQIIDASIATPDYWRRHIRQPVRFADSIQTLQQMGCDVLIEIGPKPVLLGMARQCWTGEEVLWLPSLRPEKTWSQLLESLGALYVRGAAIDWTGFDRDYHRRKVRLPTYPFQRERCWLDATPVSRTVGTAALHPLLGQRLRSAAFKQQEIVFETVLRADQPVYLADHRVHDQIVVPAAAYVEMALAAGQHIFRSEQLVIDDLVIRQPLILAGDQATSVQLVLTPNGKDHIWQIHAAAAESEIAAWTLHAEGRLSPGTEAAESVDLATLRQETPTPVDVGAHFQQFRQQGIDYGPHFQGIAQLWRGPDRALGQIHLPDALQAENGEYFLHPALLDAGFQTLNAALPAQQETFLPLAIERLTFHARPGPMLWSAARIRDNRSERVSADLQLFDEHGGLVATVEGLQLKSASRLERAAWQDWLYEIVWRPQARWTSPSYLPPPPTLLAQIDLTTPPLPELAQLDGSCARYVVDALQQLGVDFAPDARLTPSLLVERYGIDARYWRLLPRLLTLLAEVGILEELDAETWSVRQSPAMPSASAADGVEAKLLKRCGAHLADVLRGTQDPLQLLFPEGDLTAAVELYEQSPEARAMNTLAQRALMRALADLPAARRVRLLEIGAGTGGTTAHLLPHLPVAGTEYVFTDISPFFLHEAQKRFGDYPFVRYQPLDIERDPIPQGFDAGTFDVIIAVNVLHATEDLHRTLRHTRRLLAPGGLLILLELTAPRRWLDLTFGLTDGWWRFTDTDLRADYPLLTAAQWPELLQQCGFAEVSAHTPPGSQQSLLLAQADTLGAREQHWLILADSAGIGAQLADKLANQGATPWLVFAGERYESSNSQNLRQFSIDPINPADYRTLLAAVPTLAGVVHAWSLDTAETAGLTDDTLAAATFASCGSALFLTQALVDMDSPPALWLVTRGAVATGVDDLPGLAQSPLWGLGKIIAQEHPELRCVRVDLDAANATVHQLAAELTAPPAESRETQIALRREQRFVARLAPLPPPAENDEPRRLDIAARGVLENLNWQAAPRRQPGPGEIELRVLATGLNFKDVLDALGLLAPAESADGLGKECAGEVTAVGPNVTDFQIGDRVLAVVSGSLSDYATVHADCAAAYPARFSPSEAATIPIAFLTAFYALKQIAELQAGERVLIHAAAGGVGMAAVQIARHLGAEIYATASPGKWDALRALGVVNIYNSRTLDFADAIRADTHGQGIHVVLNSLTSDGFIETSLATLGTHGRFVEIAKRNIWPPARMAEHRPDVRYAIVDLLHIAQTDPPRIRALLNQLLPLFENGALRSLPCQVFAMTEAVDAFRHLQQARHIGKVVLTARRTWSPQPLTVRSDGAYLITGGLGGLGLLVARWLAERGAKNLVLVGRRPPDAAAQAQLDALTQAGVNVTIAQADVTQAARMADVLAAIELPLVGVIHSAGVLDDGVLRQQTWDRFETVLGPKVQGAWHLHRLTRAQPLDFFVLFSSVAALLGSPGQANHAAANTFLDALAQYRRAQGLPGLAINWGGWSEVGAAAERIDQIKTPGLGAIAPAQGLQILEYLLSVPTAQAGVVPIDWTQFSDDSAFVSECRPAQIVTTSAPKQETGLRQELATAPAEQRRDLLLAHLQTQAAQVLGQRDPAAIAPTQGFFDLGMDSLTSVEFRNKLQTSLQCRLPPTVAFDYPTVAALVDYLIETILTDIEFADDSKPTEADDIDELAHDDVATLLAQELSAIDEDRAS